MYNLAKKSLTPVTSSISESQLIGGVALALAAGLFLLRTLVLAAELGQSTLLGGFQMLVSSSRQDLGLVFLLTSVFLGIDLLLRTKRSKRRALIVFVVICLVVLLWGLANVEIVHLLGEPFSLDWLYYSDYLISKDAISYTFYSLNFGLILKSVLVVGAFCLSSIFFAAGLNRFFYRLHPNLLVVILAAISGYLLSLDGNSIVAPRAKTLNPVIAFVNSMAAERSLVIAGNLHNNFASDQLQSEKKLALKEFPDKIENVILFVLESTPAEYIQNYGGAYPVTPNLLKYQNRSIRFDNIYAHAPATNFSLASLLTSLFPKLASQSITQLHPDIPMITIANILAEQGHQTAFFSSSDTRFQDTDKFLQKKGFDLVEDYRNWECKSGVYKHSSKKLQYMDYSSDICTINALTSWIDQNPAKPFFSMIWTGMTHYPYTTEGEIKNYAKDESLNRYLNALRVGDEAFGNLMRYLEDKDIAESTLVVVLGDHGEAFGQHGTFVHASGLFEENLHIPLILINPKLFSGETSAEVGGVSDVAPTVLNILNLAPPDSWQGISLFSKQRKNRVFFFTPWNGFQVGFRQGNQKTIYNFDNQEISIFNLDTDPAELNDLARSNNALGTINREVLTGWVQYQSNFFEKYLGKYKDYASAEDSKIIAEATLRVDPAAIAAPLKTKNCPAKTLTIAAAGSYFEGAPQIEVSVNGKVLGQIDLTEDSIGGSFDLKTVPGAARHNFILPDNTIVNEISIRFTNDNWKSSEQDRNVNIYQVLLDGGAIRLNGVTFEKLDSGWWEGGIAKLFKNGSAIFKGSTLRNC